MAFGREKYGTELYAFNGRSSLIDDYQERLDGLVYHRKRIVEMELIAQAAMYLQVSLHSSSGIPTEVLKQVDQLVEMITNHRMS